MAVTLCLAKVCVKTDAVAWHFYNTTRIPHTVLEGMDVVMKVEAVGTQSGRPTKKVFILSSGELPVDST